MLDAGGQLEEEAEAADEDDDETRNEILEEFQDFIESVTPEDFAGVTERGPAGGP